MAMGFFSSLGNWIWDGIILNTIFGFIALGLVTLAWAIVHALITELWSRDDVRRLLNTREDNPWKVALFCLFTPIGFIGLIGLFFGLLVATIYIIINFFGNYIPFVWWGEKDAFLLFEYLEYIYAMPMTFYYYISFAAITLPILAAIGLFVLLIACLGYLIPNGENRGSLSNTNREYAALSFATFVSFFAVIVIISFSSISEFFFEMEYDISLENGYEGNDLPSYAFDSEEYFEEIDNYGGPSQTEITEGESGKLLLNPIEGGGLFTCLSLYDYSDSRDMFRFNLSDSWDANYHVRITSSEDVLISVNTNYNSSGYYGGKRSSSSESDYTTLSNNFHTSDLEKWNLYGDNYLVRGFDIGPNSSKLVKYNLAYVYAPEGITNESNQTIEDLLSSTGDPAGCGLYGISGPIEPRVRLTSLLYVGFGGFMLGCLIHRYFVILGRNGTTDSRTLFRTFVFTQFISFAFFCLIILIFDPLDGSGITGFRIDAIIEATISGIKLLLAFTFFILFIVFSIALYRQRGFIGGIARPIVERDRALRQLQDDWF